MTTAVKVVLILLAFSLVMGFIALLPSTDQYPLDRGIAAGIAVVFAYVFAWNSTFWFIGIWFWIMLLSIGFELTVWIAKQVIRLTSWVVRLFA